MIWQMVVYWVIVFVIAAYSIRSQKIPDSLIGEDPTIPTAEPGTEIPVLFGTKLIKSSNTVAICNMKIRPIRK